MGKTQEEKLQNAVALYAQIMNWYADYLTTGEARENIMEFDQLLPEYAWVSDTKKIDCLLWSKRQRTDKSTFVRNRYENNISDRRYNGRR